MHVSHWKTVHKHPSDLHVFWSNTTIVSFNHLFLWVNQEFDNADGEDCSGGSSPIQEDSLSSCPSLPEVYTLPVRDRPNCPDLKDGAGTDRTSAGGLLSELLMWIQCRGRYRIMMGDVCASVPGA